MSKRHVEELNKYIKIKLLNTDKSKKSIAYTTLLLKANSFGKLIIHFFFFNEEKKATNSDFLLDLSTISDTLILHIIKILHTMTFHELF